MAWCAGSWGEPDPGLTMAVAAGVVLCWTPGWRFLRHASTFVHEMAHALVAVILGGRVENIVYRPDASGLATFRLPKSFGRIRSIAAAGAGYAGPTVVGIVAAGSSSGGRAAAWVIGGSVLSVLALLLFVRNLWGSLYTLVVAGALAAAYLRTDWNFEYVAGVCGGVLVGGGIRGSYMQCAAEDLTGSDAGSIGRLLYVPGRLVAWAQFMLSLAGAVGVMLLLLGLA